MRDAKLHELLLPTRYGLWFRYIHGTGLETKIGPDRFTKYLETKHAIEFVNLKGDTRCKIISETELQACLSELSRRPLESLLSARVSRLVQRAREATTKRTKRSQS
jgi:hypothetical protein